MVWEKTLLLAWCAQRSVAPVWPADPWLVHCVQPHVQGPLSLMTRSPQGNMLQLFFFTSETPVSQAQSTARGWWLRMAAAHGK